MFENDDAYSVRVRSEANEHLIAAASGQRPTKGLFESKHDYRSRIGHEAREIAARGEPGPTQKEAESYNSGAASNQDLCKVATPRVTGKDRAYPDLSKDLSKDRANVLWTLVRLAVLFVVSQLVGVLLASICLWFKSLFDSWNYGLLELAFLILPIGLLMVIILIVALIVSLPTFILINALDLMPFVSRNF